MCASAVSRLHSFLGFPPLTSLSHQHVLTLFSLSVVRCRQLVPFSPDEQNKSEFSNFIAADYGNYTHKPSSQKAFDGLARMLSLFIERLGDRDDVYRCSYSNQVYCCNAPNQPTTSQTPQPRDPPPPFSKGTWPERVRAAAERAKAWRNGEAIRTDAHHLHCDAVSVSGFVFSDLHGSLHFSPAVDCRDILFGVPCTLFFCLCLSLSVYVSHISLKIPPSA